MSDLLGTLLVTEEVGVARDRELVIAGLYLPPGHHAVEQRTLAVRVDSAWAPAQLLATRASRGDDSSWVALAFPVTVRPAVSARVEVWDVTEPIAGTEPVRVSVVPDGRDVAVRHQGGVTRFGPGEYLVLPGDMLVGGAVVAAEINSEYCTGMVEQVDVRHSGSLLAEMRLAGHFVGAAGPVASLRAVARIDAYAPAMRLEVAVIADTVDDAVLDAWQVDLGTGAISRATLGAFERAASAVPPVSFGHPGGGHPRGIFAVSAVSDGTGWRDESEPGYASQWEWAELHGRVAQNWLVAGEDSAARTIAVERLWEHHPARVSCEPQRVVVHLFDGTVNGGAVLTRGAAPRRLLSISGGSDRRAGARLDHPLVGFQPDALAAVRPEVLPFVPTQFPNLESLIRAELFGWYLSGQSLGFYDHGDGMQAIPSGPRVGYSSNNEHDAIYALLLHYLRSGERAYLDSARAYGDHTVDIDQVHASPYEHEMGGLRAHGCSHVHYVDARTPAGPVRTSVDTGHMWVEGLLLLTEITGEERYLEAAVEVGECLLRLEAMGWTRPEPGPRNAGWPLVALAALGRATRQQRFLDAADRIAHTAVTRQEPDGRWLMRLGYLRDYCAWQNSVLITGLSRAADLLDAVDLRAAAERGGRAMLDLGRTPEGTFVYLGRYDYRWPQRSGLVREALACVYGLTKEPEYLSAALAGGARWYPAQGRHRVTSEEIAEWRGHLPFLGCAYSAGLLEDLQ